MAPKPEARPRPEGRPRPEARPGPEGRPRPEGRPGMRLDSWEGRVPTNDGNVPIPEGRDERNVEGKDWAMAAKPEGEAKA